MVIPIRAKEQKGALDVSAVFEQIKIDPDNTEPLYLQVAERLADLIVNQQVLEGTRLPPERKLADMLGISRTTVINAYRYLEQRGMVFSRIGSGTYAQLPETAAVSPVMPWEQLFVPQTKSSLPFILRDLVSTPVSGNRISMAAGMPDPTLYPVEALAGLQSELSLSSMDLGHIATEGLPSLRSEIAVWMQHKGIRTQPEQVMVVAGSQQGLYLITRTFIEPGDYVIVESPTYLGALQVFQAAGARILSLPVSDSFPFQAMDDYLQRYRPKLLYTMTSFQNPTGKVMPLEERNELLRMANRHRLVIVEDDPYSDLYYKQPPPPSLKALDSHGCVLYLGTFSKILFPGLRTGWLLGPETVINRLAREKQYIDLHCNNLAQHLLQVVLRNNILEPHLNRVRSEYKKRMHALADALHRHCKDNLQFTVPDGGFYLWCKIKTHTSAQTLLHLGARENISFVPGDAFYALPYGSDELRLCFVTHDSQVLTEGAKRLARIIHRLPPQNQASANLSVGKPII